MAAVRFDNLRGWFSKVTTAEFTEVVNPLAIIIFALIWIVSCITFSVNCDCQKHDCFWKSLGEIIAVSAASYFFGGIIGFIFGIPKSLQNPDRASNDSANKAGSPIQSLFFTNTSLEQISDWLTKIIVGMGLVKLTKIPSYLESLREQLKLIFPSDSSSLYGLAMMIFSCIVGFITFYIYTRINLAAQFIKEAIDNDQYTRDVVKKAATDPDFKANLINKLNSPENSSE